MASPERVLVTGATGFCGSNFVRDLLGQSDSIVVGLDAFAGRRKPTAIDRWLENPRFHFLTGDISDRDLVGRVLREYRISTVVNFAAESGVDRSIGDPLQFIENNVLGVSQLLDKVAEFWDTVPGPAREHFRFIQSSTIGVYGSAADGVRFDEETRCAPNSPYAASMAAAEQVAHAYYQTYGLPTLIARSAANYGPYQSLERLIPQTVYNALNSRPVFVYGDGSNRRDWIHVEDQCRGIRRIRERGTPGATYNLGSGAVKSNLEVVVAICRCIDELRPSPRLRESLINFVDDRPGHDCCLTIDSSKALRELGWRPRLAFEDGLRETVRWYVSQTETGAFESTHLRRSEDQFSGMALSASSS